MSIGAKYLCGVAVGLLAAGCMHDKPVVTTTHTVVATAEVAPTTPELAVQTVVRAPPVVSAPVQPQKLPDNPALAALGAPDAPDPSLLNGKDNAQITYLLGEPDFRRIDGAAEIWQYRDAACTLDLFLYPGTGVAHTEVRPAKFSTTSPQQCLSKLLKNHWLRTS